MEQNNYTHLKQLVSPDCYDNEIRNDFYHLFLGVFTIEEFLELWSLFYENKICIPTYGDVFFGNSAGDNPQATKILGQKFKLITLNGVIVVDSQVTIPYEQKGYIKAYVSKLIVQELMEYLNRYNDIIAFFYNLEEKEVGAQGLYVTYDQSETDRMLSKQSQFARGVAFSNVGKRDRGSLNMITNWLNTSMKQLINTDTYCQLIVINSNFNSPEQYIVDVLLETTTRILM